MSTDLSSQTDRFQALKHIVPPRRSCCCSTQSLLTEVVLESIVKRFNELLYSTTGYSTVPNKNKNNMTNFSSINGRANGNKQARKQKTLYNQANIRLRDTRYTFLNCQLVLRLPRHFQVSRGFLIEKISTCRLTAMLAEPRLLQFPLYQPRSLPLAAHQCRNCDQSSGQVESTRERGEECERASRLPQHCGKI